MALNPEEKPREFLITVIARLRYAFTETGAADCFSQAEEFVAEAEKRYGKIELETEPLSMSGVVHALKVMDIMQDSDGDPVTYDEVAEMVWREMDNTQREVLRQLLFTGPVWDGNIISKGHRDDLIDWGLATRCCYMGEQGYTAATYRAFTVFKAGGGTPIPAKQAVRG